MHRLTNKVVSSEREGDIAHAARNFCERHFFFDLSRRLNEIYRIAIMLIHPSGYRKNIGIKNNILGREVSLFREELVGSFTYCDFIIYVGGLAMLVKRHDNYSGSIITDNPGLFEEHILALF